MTMAIKNAYTSVDWHKTISEIDKILSEHGIVEVSRLYEDGDPVAIRFIIPFQEIPVSYKMRSNYRKVHKILKKEKGLKKNQRTVKHAKRVAWRNIKDWIDAQLALVEAQLVEIPQIFLPYMETGPNETVYDKFIEQGPKLLT